MFITLSPAMTTIIVRWSTVDILPQALEYERLRSNQFHGPWVSENLGSCCSAFGTLLMIRAIPLTQPPVMETQSKHTFAFFPISLASSCDMGSFYYKQSLFFFFEPVIWR